MQRIITSVCLSATILSIAIPEDTKIKQNVHTENSLFRNFNFISTEYTEQCTNVEGADNLVVLDLFEKNKFTDTLCNEGLKFLAGYVALPFRFKTKCPSLNLGSPTNNFSKTSTADWIEFL